MTDLAQTALDFCREVMEWEDASAAYSPDGVIWNGKGRESMAGFHYTDLNAVVAAVRGWCDKRGTKEHPLTFSLTYNWHGEYLGEVCDWLNPLHDRTNSPNPCQALLAACVEAARKLQAVA